MRRASAKLLAAGLVLLAASPAFGQFTVVTWGEFGSMQDAYTVNFLRTSEVTGQLNLADEQNAAVNKLADKYHDDIFAATMKGDLKKVGDSLKAASDEADKILKPDKAARLKKIKLQAAGLYAFQRDDVAAALKLSDKQKKAVADQIDKLKKDVKALYDSLPGVPGLPGFRVGEMEAMRKVHGMWKNAFDKIVNGLSKDQQKAWKGMIGQKFELPEPPR
jgi:hypothetical protein